MVKRPKVKQDENGNYLPNGAAAKAGLNKSILDAGWGSFIELVKHKAAWAGVTIM
jgi:putative transposase